MTIRYTLTAFATGIALLTGPLHAGGPVLEGEEPTIVAPDRAHKINPLLILGGIVLIGILAGGGSNGGAVCNGDEQVPTPEPC